MVSSTLLQSPSLGQGEVRQGTLGSAIALTGIGLHSGLEVTVELCPAPDAAGRYFVRVDLPEQPRIPAQAAYVRTTQLSTELAQAGVSVRTVEHLLAALAMTGVDNVEIRINGPEIPLLDGSAQAWVAAIRSVGVQVQSPRPPLPSLLAPVIIQEQDSFALALPADTTRLTYGIDFTDYPAIGQQWFSCGLAELTQEIAPARTFGLAEQVSHLQAAGLIKGGSLENALVCSQAGWVNPPLRFADEPVRHKIMDFWGDLALLGMPPRAHYVAYKASHTLHTRLAQALAAALFPTP